MELQISAPTLTGEADKISFWPSHKIVWRVEAKSSQSVTVRRGSRNIRQGGPDRLPHGDISEFRSY